MEPDYKIDKDTEKIIVGLTEKCVEFGLGNVSFRYYISRDKGFGVEFFLEEYKDHWELVVKGDKTDVYKIIVGKLIYKYSE